MKVFIIGLGHAGKTLARQLKAKGHTVLGSTTTEEKVESLKELVDEVAVLKGSDKEKVIAAAKGCDAIVAAAAPRVADTTTPEAREAIYEDVLVKTCESAVAACPRVIFMSSFSVYGDGGEGTEPVTEETPVTTDPEPSSVYFHAAELAALKAQSGCALRFPDMYGAPGDLTYPQRIEMSHQVFKGATPFGSEYLMYGIHYDDVAAAIIHALENELTGVYNVCNDEFTPPTIGAFLDAVCEAEGLEKLQFLNQIKSPNRKISAKKLYDTGYRVKHDDPTLQYLPA